MDCRVSSRIVSIAVAVSLTLSTLSASAQFVSVAPTVTMNPNGIAPLSGILEVEFTLPLFLSFTVTDLSTGGDFQVFFPVPTSDHEVAVLGLKPDRDYAIDLRASPSFAGPSVFDSQLLVTTDPLPEDFPTLLVLESKPDEMEPGLTLVDGVGGYVFAVDQLGEVVWYVRGSGDGTTQLEDGTFLTRRSGGCNAGCGTGALINVFGTVELELMPLGVGQEFIHHEVTRTADGNLLTLGFETRNVANYPTSEQDPLAPRASAQVRDEPVIEYLPNGDVVGYYSMIDLLDPTRIGYDSLIETPEGLDWCHANAVYHDPDDDTFVVSLRHQDALVKFRRHSGELVWILGPHDNWSAEFQPFLLTPVGARFRWHYHPHAPMKTPHGTLLVFDNGNEQASPFDGKTQVPPNENRSRVVEYRINETTMEVQQVWEWVSDVRDGVYNETLYAAIVGDADWLATRGNVLITFGGTSFTGGVANSEIGRGIVSARIIEVKHTRRGERVFDMAVFQDGEFAPVYRAERIPGLYRYGERIF